MAGQIAPAVRNCNSWPGAGASVDRRKTVLRDACAAATAFCARTLLRASRTMIHQRLALAFALTTALGASAACSKSAPPPPVDDSRSGQGQLNNAPYAPAPEAHKGVTTGQKVVVLAGAAALYYMYKHHQNAATTTGADGQYYLSKNGRVYYRDADHRAHWVTPPPEGLKVSESEAAEYRPFQGYDGNATGRDLAGLGADD